MLRDESRDKRETDAFEIDLMFTHRQIVVQIFLVKSTKGAQEITGHRPQALDGIDVDLADTIAVIIPRPFFLAVTNGVVHAFDFVVTLPFICITSGAFLGVAVDVCL